jgi:hypothetical protein
MRSTNVRFLCAISASVFLLTGCSSSEINEQAISEPVVGPSKSVLDFSFVNFNVCYPLSQLNDLDTSIEKIEMGLLSIKDLEEPLSSAAMSFDTSRMLLNSEKLYSDNPEAAQILPEIERPAYLEFLRQEHIWFSKIRVKLLDRGTLDIQLLRAEIIKVRETINLLCKK